MEAIFNYVSAAINALLAIFGKTVDEDFFSNLKSMFDGLVGFEPENKA